MNKDTFSLIDKYLTGELSGQEKEDFESRLKSSADFRNEFEEYKISVEALLEYPLHEEAASLAKKLHQNSQAENNRKFISYQSGKMSDDESNAFETRLKEDALFAFRYNKYSADQKNSGTPKVVRLNTYFRIGIAASVLVVLSVMTWMFFSNQLDIETIVAGNDIEALIPDREVALMNEGLIHRGIEGSTDFNELKLLGLDAYERKDWDQAIRLLNEYLDVAVVTAEEMPDEINLVNLYIGRAWMEKEEIGKAISSLEAAESGIVDTVNYELIKELIQWQLALAHLKNKDVESSKEALRNIVNAKHPGIKTQATIMLNELK